ncbi:acyltransferase family protein [Jeotgalibacillus haloalkalitolerans]|uniref:Acyltransferase family protein n=1 Tax=Jeotgalibacillus haloalkalitolerans TaxID=3104292 RepID=A0ABU5KJL5_9BACL|nr:acyltransferase family protein [Jeotgalibacillus sp. HH7-29]MDZ5711441.1 acyltransferase family protein [Jeotgalibacillus sp. HH7-29]
MKPLVKEIFLLRALACLAVVFIHAITSLNRNVDGNAAFHHTELIAGLSLLQVLLMFGTPMFIFISEFVLAKTYHSSTPAHFLTKRMKYIFVPFLVIGFVTMMIDILQAGSLTGKQLLFMFYDYFIAGNFNGYFIMIIFQFYLLHLFFIRYVQHRFSPKAVLSVSIAVNLLYLSYFNFVDPYTFFPYKMTFLAWIGYFTIAFYCGKYHESFLTFLNRYKYMITLTLLVTAASLVFLHVSGLYQEIHSKRIDIFIYTVSLAFFLFYVGTKLNSLPSVIVKISQYSFGIYLLHPFFLLAYRNLLNPQLIQNDYLYAFVYLVFAAVISISGSILTVFILNKFKAGAYIAGKVGRPLVQTEKKAAVSVSLEKQSV